MPDTTVLAWIALGAALAATVLVAVTTIRMRRQWRTTAQTRDAARALVDVHREQIERSIDAIAEQAETVGAHGAELMESVEELRANVQHLTWLFGRIPEARDSLRQTLIDIVLPTGAPKESQREQS